MTVAGVDYAVGRYACGTVRRERRYARRFVYPRKRKAKGWRCHVRRMKAKR